jgi:nucleoside-diphosphate-sugar epimerase
MILVTEATGNVGREVVNVLLEDGKKVVAVTRNPAAAALPGGAHVVGGDPSHPQTLTSALRGVEAVLISPRALGDATAGAATAGLLALAAEQGVERAVALSAATVHSTLPGIGASPTPSKSLACSGPSCGPLTTPPTPWPGRRRSARPESCGAPTATRRPRRYTSGTLRRSPHGHW